MGNFKRPILFAISIFFVQLLGLTSPVQAAGEGLDLVRGVPSWPSPDIPGIRPLGMGNAGLALADGPEAIFLNPAGMGFNKTSYLEAGFYFHPAADNRIFNLSIVDSKTNPYLAGGISYSYYISPRTDDGKYQSIFGHIIRLSSAYHSGDLWSVGLSLKYLNLIRPFFPPLSVFNLDIGLSWQILKWLSVAITGYNLIYNDSGETPIALGVGAAVGMNLPFRIAVDALIDFQTGQKLKGQVGFELRIGASYNIKKLFTVRAGYQYDQVRDGHFISLGLSFTYRAKFALEAAFRQELATGRRSENRFLAFSAMLNF